MADSFVEDTPPDAAELLHDATQPLRDHMTFIVVFVLSAMLSALALTYIYSERFRGEATILFKPAQLTRLTQTATQALGSPFPTNTAFKAVDQTITQMLDSGPLLREVVTDLHLDVPPPRITTGPWYIQLYNQYKDALEDYAQNAWQYLQWGRLINDPVNSAVALLRRDIKVSSTDSYVYSLTVLASTPERAKAIANDLGARLIDKFRGVDVDAADSRRAQLGKLKDDKGREVEGIEEQIRNLLAENEVGSLTDDLTEATKRASHLQTLETDTAADLRESDARVAELTAKVRSVAAPAELSAELQSGRSNPTGPQPGRLTATDYTRLTSDKLDAQVRNRGLSAKLALLDRAASLANARLQTLAKVQAQYDFLSARLAAAKRDYAALSDSYLEATMDSATGQSQLQVQAEATAPPMPISPIKIYHVGAAGGLALIIAVGLAYVFSYLDFQLFLPRAGGGRPPKAVALPAAAAPGSAPA